jgi:hypothetical protein
MHCVLDWLTAGRPCSTLAGDAPLAHRVATPAHPRFKPERHCATATATKPDDDPFSPIAPKLWQARQLQAPLQPSHSLSLKATSSDADCNAHGLRANRSSTMTPATSFTAPYACDDSYTLRHPSPSRISPSPSKRSTAAYMSPYLDLASGLTSGGVPGSPSCRPASRGAIRASLAAQEAHNLLVQRVVSLEHALAESQVCVCTDGVVGGVQLCPLLEGR